MEKMLVRHDEPGKYDQAPQGTLCKSLKVHSVEFDIYMQISSQEDNPHWELVGRFRPETEHRIKDEIKRKITTV